MEICPNIEHPEIDKNIRLIALLTYILSVLPIPFLFVWFLCCRRWCGALKQRSVLLTSIIIICPWNLFLIREYLGRGKFTCFITENAFLLEGTSGLFSEIATGVIFYARMNRSKFLAEYYLTAAHEAHSSGNIKGSSVIAVSKPDVF
eukprot:snap_masked-scaffold_14-processed-gene-10.53-mRNA-1 protein AED:1.00 eAED:1.00 QI:0/0/0/0/1/1/2/0/146